MTIETQKTLIPKSSTAIPVSPKQNPVASANSASFSPSPLRPSVISTKEPTPIPTMGLVTVIQSPSIESTRFRDGAADRALFNSPSGLVIDKQNNMYVADTLNHRIRKIDPFGTVSTIAGDGNAGFRNGPGAIAQFNQPFGLALDQDQNLFITDKGNHAIRKMTIDGNIITIAGQSRAGFKDGTTDEALFHSPMGIAVDSNMTLYIADTENHRIRKITQNKEVTTLAGTGKVALHDGTYNDASFNSPRSLQIDSQGNIYVSDYDIASSMLRKLTPSGNVLTIYSKLRQVAGFVIGTTNTIYLNDLLYQAVIKLDVTELTPTNTKGSYMAVNFSFLTAPENPNISDGIGPLPDIENNSIFLKSPQGIALSPVGELYVTDTQKHFIAKLQPSSGFSKVKLFAGITTTQ